MTDARKCKNQRRAHRIGRRFASRSLAALASRAESPHAEVFITTNCFAVLSKSPESLMCHFSRCIQKIDGALLLPLSGNL
jgi:hypothetical protein